MLWVQERKGLVALGSGEEGFSCSGFRRGSVWLLWVQVRRGVGLIAFRRNDHQRTTMLKYMNYELSIVSIFIKYKKIKILPQTLIF